MQHDVLLPTPEYVYRDGLVRCTVYNKNGERCRRLVSERIPDHICNVHRAADRRRAAKKRRLSQPGRKEKRQCEGITRAGTRCEVVLYMPIGSTDKALCGWHVPRTHWRKPHE